MMKFRKTGKCMFAVLLVLCTLLAWMLPGCNSHAGQTTRPESVPTTAPETTLAPTTQAPTTQAPTTEPATVPTTAPEATQPDPDPGVPMLDIYVSPNGNDANNGLSEASALKSLEGASKLLVAAPFAGNVTIHVAEGEYLVQESAYWRYSNPGYTTYIEGAGQDKTVFCGPMGQDVTFLTVSSCNDTSISFKNFTVRLFRNGIIMRCSADGTVLTNEDVTGWFENITFEELGGYYTRCENAAFAGMQLLGSSNNTVKNCKFLKMRDYTTSTSIHALYISTFSCNNLIQGCLFEDVRPDPIRLRRGSSYNTVENCTFVNSGVIAYVSDWSAGEAEPEPSVGNVVRNNDFHGGYFGTKIANVCIFRGGTNTPIPLDPARLLDSNNTVHPSQFNPEVKASVKNYTVKVDGRYLEQQLPVYSMDRYEGYVDLDDLAVLLKGTPFAFTYSTPDEEETVTTKFTVVLSDAYTGTEFTVQPDAAEGEIMANQAKGWSITNLSKSKGAIYERNGDYYISLETIQDMLTLSDQSIFLYEFDDTTLSVRTIFEHVDVPETMPVYMLKLPGSFSQLGSNNGRYSMTDMSNFDVVTMNTEDLEHLIRFRDLYRDDVDFVIVGIPIGSGTFGVREWKNKTVKDYYYYGTNKLTGLNRAWTDSSNGYANCFYKDMEDLVYYTIIPVGQPLELVPQYRIAENWTTGSISNYSEIFITDSEHFKPIEDISAVTSQSMSVSLNGTGAGSIPVYTSALGKGYLNIADMAQLLKGTDYGFTYAVNGDARQITVTMGAGYAGSGFSTPAGSLNVADWRPWTLQVNGKTMELSAFLQNGICCVDPGILAEALGIHCAVNSKGVNVLFSLELPETVDVLMLNFSGNLENQNATAVDQHKIKLDPAAFTVVPTATDKLSGIIDFSRLMKDGFKYVIVGVELKGGIWGVREFKNNAAADYYTYADRKWSTGSGGFSDCFYNSSESQIYYMIVPVGDCADSDPQLRIKQGWEKGSPANYTQIIFTKCAEYLP